MSPQSASLGQISPVAQQRARSACWQAVLAFYGYVVFVGLAVADPAYEQYMLFAQLASGIFLARWMIIDARNRREPIPLLAQCWCLIFAPLVVPVYFLWTRRWRGLGWLALYIFVAIVVLAIVVGLPQLLGPAG